MRRSILFAFTAFAILSFSPRIEAASFSHKGTPVVMAQPAPDTISPQDLQKKLKAHEKLVLIDVRQPDEHEAFALPDSLLIPLATLPEHLKDVPKDKPVVVYCRSGARSGRAEAFLRAQGFTNVTSLSGGMNAWAQMLQTEGTSACKNGTSC